MDNKEFLITVEHIRKWNGISGSVAQDVKWGWDMASGSDYTVKTKFIRCPYCGTRNPNIENTYYCQACGGPLEE